MILTRDFLSRAGACLDGYRGVLENDLLGKEIDDVISYFESIGESEYAEWLTEQKSTEQYVRENGKVITMTTFKVFNPLTGVHTEYNTEEEARAAMVALCSQILEIHSVSLVRAITNENGDSAWVAAELSEPVRVV